MQRFQTMGRIERAAIERGMTEREYLIWALGTAGTKRAAARLIEVSPEWLYSRLTTLGIVTRRATEIIEQEPA